MTDLTYGNRFASRRVAENYRFRPPYSPELFATLKSLVPAAQRAVLDAGCGTGKVTFGLVDDVDRIDAIDPSDEMLRVALADPRAASEKIRWIHSTAEEASLDPPYGLIVASLSIHWMKLDRVLPRFAGALASGCFLAIVDYDGPAGTPWERDEIRFAVAMVEKVYGHREKLWPTIGERIGAQMLTHPAFELVGYRVTTAMPFTQSITDYLRCLHSRATWSEDHMGEAAVREFDAGMIELLSPYVDNGILTFPVQNRVEWGRLRA